MLRRTFIQITGLGAIGALAAGCAEASTLALDTAAPDAGPVGDAFVAVPDAGSLATDAAGAAFVVTSAFTILLNDTSCSGHDHECDVEPAAYVDDTPVQFLGGSHLVAFRPSELVRFERGERMPFATIGPGPGHGHCGIAWRADLGGASRDRVDMCTTMSPADGPPAICELHPHA